MRKGGMNIGIMVVARRRLLCMGRLDRSRDISVMTMKSMKAVAAAMAIIIESMATKGMKAAAMSIVKENMITKSMKVAAMSIVKESMATKSMKAAAAATITIMTISGMTMNTVTAAAAMTIVTVKNSAVSIAAAAVLTITTMFTITAMSMLMNRPASRPPKPCPQACRGKSISSRTWAVPTVPQRWSGRSRNFRE